MVQIMAEMQHNQIRSYPFDADENDDEELQLNERIRVSYVSLGVEGLADRQEMLPFAVVGSERSVVIDGKPVRGRKNRWGVINVEDERHCEFVYLRNFLTRSAFLVPQNKAKLTSRTHLQDLIETTAQIHYETFRAKQLLALKESSSKAAAQAAGI
jgi:septin 3/9/12